MCTANLKKKYNSFIIWFYVGFLSSHLLNENIGYEKQRNMSNSGRKMTRLRSNFIWSSFLNQVLRCSFFHPLLKSVFIFDQDIATPVGCHIVSGKIWSNNPNLPRWKLPIFRISRPNFLLCIEGTFTLLMVCKNILIR